MLQIFFGVFFSLLIFNSSPRNSLPFFYTFGPVHTDSALNSSEVTIEILKLNKFYEHQQQTRTNLNCIYALLAHCLNILNTYATAWPNIECEMLYGIYFIWSEMYAFTLSFGTVPVLVFHSFCVVFFFVRSLLVPFRCWLSCTFGLLACCPHRVRNSLWSSKTTKNSSLNTFSLRNAVATFTLYTQWMHNKTKP